MELRRTANAGFLLKLDGAAIALDGVCREVPPYLATPPAERDGLLSAPPDLLAFTHTHADHFDAEFAAAWFAQTGKPILGSGEVAKSLPQCRVEPEKMNVGSLQLTAIPTRHIGKSCLTSGHVSFIIKGTACVWFAGDATPTALSGLAGYPAPDVLIAPYAYVTTGVAMRVLSELAPKHLILTHLPLPEQDPYGLWEAVRRGVSQLHIPVTIPELSQTLQI